MAQSALDISLQNYLGRRNTPAVATPTTTSVATQDPNELQNLAQSIFNMYSQFQQPAVNALQQAQQRATSSLSSIYDTRRAAIQGEIDPTKQRYQQLLDEVSRREQAEKQQTQSTVAAEYSRRGIPLNSGVYEQDLTKALSPVSQAYAGQATNVGLQGETEQRNLQNAINQLTGQQGEAMMGLETGIGQGLASLYGSLGGNVFNTALSALGLRRQTEENTLNRALSEREIALKEKAYNEGNYIFDPEAMKQNYLKQKGGTTNTTPLPKDSLSLGLGQPGMNISANSSFGALNNYFGNTKGSYYG